MGRANAGQSVVLHKVDPDGVFALPLEGQAPRHGDVDRVADWLAPQPVEVETRSVHFLWFRGYIQACKPYPEALNQIGQNSRGIAAVPQGGKRAAPE